MDKTDTELVLEFLRKTARVTDAAARGRLVGRSAGTVRRWIRETREGGTVRPLLPDVRVALEDYLAGVADVPHDAAVRALKHIEQVARRAVELPPDDFAAYLSDVEAIMPIAEGGAEPDGAEP